MIVCARSRHNLIPPHPFYSPENPVMLVSSPLREEQSYRPATLPAHSRHVIHKSFRAPTAALPPPSHASSVFSLAATRIRTWRARALHPPTQALNKLSATPCTRAVQGLLTSRSRYSLSATAHAPQQRSTSCPTAAPPHDFHPSHTEPTPKSSHQFLH